jgi:flagellar basal body-associated protein FliL
MAQTEKPQKGYGKRSTKQWVVIYVVIAIIVYALVYFMFIHKSSNGGSGGLGY